MGYVSVELEDVIHIEELYTVHYYEYMNDFFYEGESHNFWEFIYVDRAEVTVMAGDKELVLTKGDVLFHKPNEFHNVKAMGGAAPNLVVASFSCNDPAMKFFEGKLFQVDELERNLLADIILEARDCFSSRLDDPYLTHLKKKNSDAFGSEQMLRIYLEYFLIHLVRRNTKPISFAKDLSPRFVKTTKSKNDMEVLNRVIAYLEKNINGHVTIDTICRENLVGRTQLQKLFREKCGKGVIEYFTEMKIDTAKQMIRTNRMNFTQISEVLGYNSIHYFSRQFKQLTGMSPTEYASSIQALSEGHSIMQQTEEP